jgi:hypothetical protein
MKTHRFRAPLACLTMVLIALGACGDAERASDAARMSMSIAIPAPEYRGLSTDTNQQIEQLRAVSLVVMVCDDVTAVTTVPCNRREARTYHVQHTFSLTGDSGSETLSVPPGTNQVIFAQGLNTQGDVTYHGYATMAVIQPRAEYVVPMTLVQIRFANLPPPEAPVILEPENNTNVLHPQDLVIRGSRQQNTVLRVKAHRDLIGKAYVEYNGPQAGYSQETDPDDETQLLWTLAISPARIGSLELYTFQSIRAGQYSPEVTRSYRFCASTGCPP